MNDPTRFLDSDDAPEHVQQLLAHASRPRALDEATRRRSRRRVASLSAVPAAAGAFFWLQHLALGAALGTVVASAVVAPRLVADYRAEPRSVPVARPATVAVPPRPVAPAHPEVADVPEATQPVPTPSTPASRGAGSAEAGLEREARLLERARSLLDRGPRDALAVLERHAAEFPRGTLTTERELLEVDALVRLGRRSAAEAKARALRAHAPGSIYERRLTDLLRER
ncbi:MAG TPA: hypothetical protein VHE30_30180 [Polyangiaceae bacterium]|nr:hypothetical protein [Polyangiaceae bacterium]